MNTPLLTAEQEASFHELYSIVTGEARRLVASPRAADFDRDDALQVGAMALCDAIRSHDPTRGPLQPYARLAVRRGIIDAFRQQCGREPGSVRRKLAGAGQLNDEMGTADRALDAADSSDDVKAALDWFEPLERQIVELHYLECLKLEDVGERIGMSVSRVCQIVNKAINRLREESGEMPNWWRLASRSGKYKAVRAGGGVKARLNKSVACVHISDFPRSMAQEQSGRSPSDDDVGVGGSVCSVEHTDVLVPQGRARSVAA